MRRKSSSTSHTRPPGQRQLRVAEQIRHVLVEILQRGHLRDPALEKASLITVTAVDIGPDLQHAVVYVMPLGGKDSGVIVEALNRAAGYFRSELAAEMELRYTPKVSFKVDNSFDEAEHINRLLYREEVRRDIEKPARDEDDDTHS